jgi:hypothetical protein
MWACTVSSDPASSVITMPSGEHESPIELVKQDPDLAVWLLAQLFEVEVPTYHHARLQPTDVRVLVPRTYHADAMLLFCDAADQAVLAAVLEVQRGWDPDKRWTWPLYVAQLQAELQVDAALLVYCPDRAVARRYRDMFAVERPSLRLRPLLFTPADVPLVVDLDLARANPALTVLSVICHGDGADVEAVFPALAEALRALGTKKAVFYHEIVLAGLPHAPRARWEAFMTTTVGHEYRSAFFRQLKAEGLAEAKEEMREQIRAEVLAEGEGRAVLIVLETRGVEVPAEVREKILACPDLDQLAAWLRHAVTATTIEDVLRR